MAKMKPILKLIRTANIGKHASQKLADEAFAEYNKYLSIPRKLEEIEDANGDGWDAWIEFKEWFFDVEQPQDNA